ncbi:VOC family protein [Streptomyces sp. NPDC002790]|uniref:VOC family protein n=1 Tax=Streptomyces sp. NPDC002790 TaxID=3154431 RepID=UPI00332D7D79
MRPARRDRLDPPDFPEGAPCWADARLADVEAGKRFYGDLFGWTFDEGAGAERGYYTAAYSGDRSVAALAPANRGARWRVHLAVRDAYAAAERVFAAGGHIVAGPLPGGTAATVALARGPEGAVFVLRQAGTHRGFEGVGGAGAFRGAELLTPDAALSDSFYGAVFGEGAFAGASSEGTAPGAVSFEGAAPGTVSSEGAAPGAASSERADPGTVSFERADPGTVSFGGTGPGDGPSWEAVRRRVVSEGPGRFLLHFGCADVDATAAAAVRLGGRVRVGPRPMAYGRAAVIQDDQGAVFVVCEQA